MSALGELGFAFEIGDVVSIAGQDSWLERGSMLWDGNEPLAVIFETREGWLWHARAPEELLQRLRPIEPAGLEGLPLSFQLDRRRLERRLRRPVRIAALNGGSLPEQEATFALYRGLECRLYALTGLPALCAWRAEAVSALDVARY